MSFNTSSIQSDTYTANVQINAPKHVVGTVELSDTDGALVVNGLSVNTDLLNTDYVVSTVSVTTPLIVGDVGFPVTVQNLKTVTLNSGAGTVNQVLALNSDLDLVFKDDAVSVVPTLNEVLTAGASAGDLGITNLKSLTVTAGAGTVGQVLALDSSLDLVWKDDAVSVVPTIAQVLNAGNDADGSNLINLQTVQAQALNLLNTSNWTLAPNASTDNLDVSTLGAGYVNLGFCPLVSGSYVQALNIIPTVNPTPYDVWVSPAGNDISAMTYPSINNPFLTIQSAIDYCQTLTVSDNIYRYVHIMAGNYTEDLNIYKKMYIVGEAQTSQSASVGCQITGLITIAVDANGTDMFSNGVHLQGLLISGSVLNVSTVPAMLIMENCYVYTPNDATGTGISHNVTSSDSRLKLWNVQVISGGKNGLSPLINVQTTGLVSMNYCYVSAKGVQQCLRLSGTATCDSINNCKFENSNLATVTAEPIVKITANVSGTYTFSNCAFIYSNNGNKSANLNASGILNANGTGNNTVISLYNTFLLAGTDRLINYAIQDLNHTNPSTLLICLYYMSGAIPNTAFAIRGNNNQTKFQLEICS